jgi:hypothetical protein
MSESRAICTHALLVLGYQKDAIQRNLFFVVLEWNKEFVRWEVGMLTLLPDGALFLGRNVFWFLEKKGKKACEGDCLKKQKRVGKETRSPVACEHNPGTKKGTSRENEIKRGSMILRNRRLLLQYHQASTRTKKPVINPMDRSR